jgi:aminoglycoside phosphotransferase (APT) family kinase protein
VYRYGVTPVEPIGPKLAQGRDSEIFEHGPGKVLRVPRDGRSLVREAEIMAYVLDRGYPVPAVHDAGDGYLVMDRIEGRPMLDDAIPFRLGRNGALLARLHNELHEIPAPDWLPESAAPGDCLVHRDLHPLNVLITADGPIVIDWSNAARGVAAYDVADMWLLFTCADPEGLNAVERLLAPLARKLILRAFLAGVDKEAARALLPVIAEHRAKDRNMSAVEIDRMRSFAARTSNLPRP